MDAFSTAELSGMQAAQEEAMQDTCVLLTWFSGSQNAFGEQVETWTPGDPLACGYNPQGGREVAGADAAPILTDATVRLPISTEVDRKDRLQITHRFGVAITPETFEIIGEPRRGPSGLLLDLRRAEL
jgi:hypothetical protein